MGNSRASRQRYNEKRRLKRQQKRGKTTFRAIAPDSPDLTAEEILGHKRRIFQRLKEYEESRQLIHMDIDVPGPYAIWHFGDLHLDDDGMDVFALERDIDIVLSTPAMYAGHVGDVLNSWIGRLAHLYAQQSTTARQAWILARHFLGKLQPRMLYLCRGNHDMWNKNSDLLEWIANNAGITTEPWDMRISFDPPLGGRSVTMNIKHTHKGNSMWNQAHGQMRFAQKGIRDNVIISGHRHISGYGIVVDPLTQKLCHCIQVAAYKIYDDYGRSNDMDSHFISPSVVTVIDPQADSETGLVTVFHDTAMAAQFLTFLRRARGV